MDINIKTKFSVNDVVYGFYRGNIIKFRVDDVKVKLDYYSTEISYLVTELLPPTTDENAYITFSETFEECELHTREELITALEKILKEEENGL